MVPPGVDRLCICAGIWDRDDGHRRYWRFLHAERFCRRRQRGHEPVFDTAVRRFWLLYFCSVQPATPRNNNDGFCT